MPDYRTRAEEVQRCCRKCIRATSSTTTGITPYYCMARKTYVSPFSVCVWFTDYEKGYGDKPC